MILSSLRALALAGCLVAPSLAHAQHAHSHAAPNGGQLREIGAYEAELVVKGGQAVLYLTDQAEKKVDASAFSATASVLAAGNQPKSVVFRPAGENRLVAPIDFPIEGKFRATLTLATPSGEAGRARFSLDAK